ncbi:MAG TPA: TetR/AcrR family transcriptional regulator [Chthoniobacterales bacterium]|jgi:AcrR family transcriptional regulator|nr:TetR/AcrR family transcriptional regulator [Chthoniobacterales bacterium]
MTRNLKAEDRRPAIAEAVIPVFARHGFVGATTKKLAEAAGVSEALLYKYFPSKEAIYQEIVRLLPKRIDNALWRLSALKPSTESLICWTHAWAHRFLILDGSEQQEDLRNIHRVILNSLKEDGEFARRVFKKVAQEQRVDFQTAYEAAKSAGDIAPDLVDPTNVFWFVHNTIVMTAYSSLPARTTIDYLGTNEELVRQTVVFVLRGLGMKDRVIAAKYNAKTLALVEER